MTTPIGEAFVRLRPDASGFGSEAKRSVTGQLGGIAKAAAGAFATGGLIKGIVGVTRAGSDLGEQINKVNVVFGTSAPIIQEWSKNSATALGQSRTQALEAAGTYGNLFRAFGVGTDASQRMSTSMVELAADLASFNNASPEDVLLALRSGLTGETEPLRRFGVALTAARVEEEALRLGLAKQGEELSAAAKSQATYSLIMKDTTLAQGDFARTSDSVANRQRILSARWEDLKSKIGTALQGPAQAFLGFLTDRLLPGLERIGVFVGKLGGVARDFFNGDILSAGARLAEMFNLDPKTTVTVIRVMQRVRDVAIQVFDFLKRNGRTIAIVFAAIFAPLATLTAGLIYLYFHSDRFRQIVQAVAGYLSEQFGNAIAFITERSEAFREAAANVFNFVREVITRFVDITVGLWNLWGDEILRIITIAFNFIRGVISDILRVIRGIIDVFLGVLTGDWSRAWDGIKNIFGAVWSTIVRTLGAVVALITQILSGAWELITRGVSVAWDKIVGFVKTAADTIVGAIMALPGRLLAFGFNLFNAALELGGKFLGGLKAGLKAVAGFAGDVATGIVNVVIDAWNKVAGMINDFVPNKVGFGIFSVDLPDNPIPTFDRLAGGAELDRPTLALVGERPSSFRSSRREIVTPEELMRKVVREELGTKRDAPLVENLTMHALDARTGAKAVADELAWMWELAG